MSNEKSNISDSGVLDSRVRVIPKDLGPAFRPFDTSTAATKKCYVVFDAGPPRVLTEVPCGDIIIVETADVLEVNAQFGIK